jgi:cobaltochelatase CobT
MSDTLKKTRQQQKVEDLCAATIRSMAAEPDIIYRGHRLYKGRSPLPIHAPHLQLDPQKDGFHSFRAVADSVALRLQHTDRQTHHRFCPTEPLERLIFELLEQLRVETLVPENMPGMTKNLLYRFAEWSEAFHVSGLTGDRLGLLLYTVFQMCWSRLSGQPVLEITEGLIEASRASLAPLLGKDLAGMRRTCSDQAAYASYARSLAGVVSEMIHFACQEQTKKHELEKDEDTKRAFKLLLNFDSEDANELNAPYPERSDASGQAQRIYRIYTTQYDRTARASSQVRTEALRELRERLDRRIAEHAINIPRLVRQLVMLLALPQRDGWSFGEEDGYIDGGRLAQVITSPSEQRVFRLEQHRWKPTCAVGFLVDCSGSMKGHAEAVAIVVDVFTRALEQAGISTEVLGFTTGAWNGGRAQSDWLRAGRPRNPGRINEVLHMVFKEPAETWRHARQNIAALLKLDLYREGVDGEAVDWACARMQTRKEKRRILVVISDGCPMDSATGLANNDRYLAEHLKEVAERHEQRGDVEICGLGIGLDLSAYYSRSLATNLPQSLTNDLFLEIAQLISGHRQH